MRRRLFKSAAPTGDGLDVGALAPMVDMMTLLLIFLLRSYSTEAAPTPPSGPFELADTSSEDPRTDAVEILVSPEGVWVDGHPAGAWKDVEPGALIRSLYEPLLLIRGRTRVEVHSDRRVPYAQLQRVLSTARAAGYEELTLVAANRSSL